MRKFTRHLKLSLFFTMLGLSPLILSGQNVFAQEVSILNKGLASDLISKLGHNNPTWEKYYRNGLAALEARRYDQAEEMLNGALKASQAPMAVKKEFVLSRIALGKLYVKKRSYNKAAQILNNTKAVETFGKHSIEAAELEYNLALCELAMNRLQKAKAHSDLALEVFRFNEAYKDTTLHGLVLDLVAVVHERLGWAEDAREHFLKAHQLLEKNPGHKQMDFADSLRNHALFYHKLGDRKQAVDLYEKSVNIKEAALTPNKPAQVAGEVLLNWEPGSTRSQEIIDTEFPFRYQEIGGIRVAATVIDLWELLGVLITITNTGSDQAQFELGKVQLFDMSKGAFLANEVPPIDPNRIDRIRRERVMWDLTHTRPWLANVQKTRTVRGLVPPSGHDLFMGPNVFGVWGEWKAVSHTVPVRVGILPSREGLIAQADQTEQVKTELPGLLSGGYAKYQGLVPIVLEPFESRTGDLFYLNPRDKDVMLRVPVGNAVFEFPFHTRKLKIP